MLHNDLKKSLQAIGIILFVVGIIEFLGVKFLLALSIIALVFIFCNFVFVLKK